MGAPHNPDRYGEIWDQKRIDLCLAELRAIRFYAVLSGGWAWHFMSPPGHPEYKHAHDHKDIDIHVPPTMVPTVIAILKGNGFEKVWTRYDKLPSDEDFRRYEKVVGETRITIDFFVKSVPFVEIDGWRVVRPETLLTFYGDIHSSDKCFAVQAATRLIAEGIDPIGHPDLVTIPTMEG